MPKQPLTPSPNRIEPPPFHVLDENLFEELCCSLLDAQDDVATCDRDGLRGEEQFGIDLLITLKTPGTIAVGQCKCCENFPPREIRAVSDNFLKHWESHWKTRGVRRFILFVACDLSERKRREQLDAERRRFAELGIVYEAWSPRVLAEKLAPHWQIVARYLDPPEVWVPRICGHTVPSSVPSTIGIMVATGAVTDAMLGTLLRSTISGVASQVQELRVLARRGQGRAALARLAEFQSNTLVWSALEARQRAEILRLRASLLLREPDGIVEAERLAAQADEQDLGDADATRLRALIILAREGPEAALHSLERAGGEPQEIAQIRMVALMRLGRPAEAADLGRAIVDRAAETERLLAVTLLASGHGEEGENAARRAVAETPDLWLARMTLGIVLYYNGLSPAAVPVAPGGAWPDPPAWPLVRRDDASLARFREAFGEFERVGASRADDTPPAMIAHWKLACLANDPERRKEAAALCRALLLEDRTDPAAIAWALARAFPFDKKRSRDAIEALLAAGKGDTTHAMAAVAIDLAGNRGRKAAKLLRSQQHLFEQESAGAVYDSLLAQAQAVAGEAIEAVSDAASDSAAAFLATEPGGRPVDGEVLSSAAARAFAQAGNAALAMACLARLAQDNSWSLVVHHLDALVHKVGTADAIRMAAYALASTGRAAEALRLLDSQVGVFPGGRLPRDLIGLRRDCLAHTGALSEALSLGSDLARESNSTADLLSLAELQIRVGDPRLASGTIRRAVGSGPLAAPEAVRYAKLLSSDDPELARRLLQNVDAAQLGGGHLGMALDAAHRLGMDLETKPLMERMAAAAAEGTSELRLLSFDEGLKVIHAAQETAQKLGEMYSAARIPIHLMARQVNLNLARLYHADLAEWEQNSDGQPQGALLARHGGRDWPERDHFPRSPSDVRLHVDVTALLLAHHLRILDLVERCFRPLRISQHLVPALVDMRLKAQPRSPAQIDDLRRLITLVEDESIQVTAPPEVPMPCRSPQETSTEAKWLAAEALRLGGVVVDWYPPDLSVEEALAARFVNCRGVVSILVEARVLDGAAGELARQALGSAGEEPSRALALPRGGPIFFHANTIDGFVRSGALEAASRAFAVFIEKSRLEMARQEVEAANKGIQLAAWTADLMERVSCGIKDGTYQLLPMAVDGDGTIGEVPRDHLVSGLTDLLKIRHEPGDVVWFDDRHLTAYGAAEQTPIVGCPEILKALLAYGRVSEPEYLERLLRLRAGRVLFITPEQDEIAHHLLATGVTEGIARESPAMGVLRRYLAASLVCEETLERPPLPTERPNPGGEVLFVSRWQGATEAAVLAAWCDDAVSDDVRAARAQLAIDSFYVEQHRTFPAQGGPEGKRKLAACRIASLAARAIALVGDTERVLSYLQWLDAALLRPRLEADPDLLSPFLKTLGGLLGSLVRTGEAGEDRELSKLAAALVVNSLPEHLRSRASADSRFRDALGLAASRRIITLEDTNFDAKAFWLAGARAIETGSSEVRSVGGTTYRIETRSSGESGVPLLSFGIPGQRAKAFSDALMALLLQDRSAWEVGLRQHREWFDVPSAALKEHIARLALLDDPGDRLDAILEAREDSTRWHYLWLEERIAAQAPLTVGDMRPPTASSMLRHLRLDDVSEEPVALRLERAAHTLVEEEGVEEAVLRLGGLPIPLPKPVMVALRRMLPDDLRSLVEGWAASPSPLSRIHLLHVVATFEETPEANVADLRAIAERLLSDAEEDGMLAALTSVLAAVDGWFGSWHETASLGEADRLVLTWAHAHRLLTAFVRAGARPGWIAAEFRRLASGGLRVPFQASQSYRDDVAYPRGVGRVRLLVLGIHYALADRSAEVLGPAQAGRLRSMSLDPSGNGLLIAELLTRVAPDQDVLGSFLAADLDACLKDVLGWDTATSYLAGGVEALADGALVVLQAPNEQTLLPAWLLLRAVVGDRPPPPAISARLDACIRDAQLPLLDEESVGPVSLVLQFIGAQAARSADPKIRDSVEDKVLAAACALHERGAATPKDGCVDPRCALLLNAGLWLAQRDQPRESAEAFGVLMVKLARAMPDLALVARRLLFDLCRSLPLVVAEPIWPPLTFLRANL